MRRNGPAGFLTGVRVLEVADELGEYCGKLLAGLGAEVIKIEPPGGEPTRTYGPFYKDIVDPNCSLYFWHYNLGKLGLILDLDDSADVDRFNRLVDSSAVLLETRPSGYWSDRGLDFEALRARNPGLILARISPFGDSGPWAGYKGSDLVHLALGGVVMNCGYDSDPRGHYDTPPIAPQMWQAYHIAGEMMVMAVISALYHRRRTGLGQRLSEAVHDAVSKQTETDLPNWIYSHRLHYRQTCRHSRPDPEPGAIMMTKDGRWVHPYVSYLARNSETGDFAKLVELLDGYGMAEDLTDARHSDFSCRSSPAAQLHISDVTRRFIGRLLFSHQVWTEAQDKQLTWAPLLKPEENCSDPHWLERKSFFDVEHPELNDRFTYVGAKWTSAGMEWPQGPRAPLLGEHGDFDRQLARQPHHSGSLPKVDAPGSKAQPFPLAGVRVIDLGWIVASGGAGRFLAALGAEVIKVEHWSRPDLSRWGNAMVPTGGRPEAEAGAGPMSQSPNRSGFFMDLNAGKRAISLNLKHSRGRELLTRLIEKADVLSEGYSPHALERMGFSYKKLKQLNPGIIYAQQSGMGYRGSYGDMRSYGPVAQGFSGISEMSGLAEPFPPAGIGYSYLDWFGAYNLVNAILAALYRRDVTGEGCWLDLSQVESGIYLTGTAILDFTVNGRGWRRYGNRSPYKMAAPHGAYRTAGDDRWIAIACFTEAEWQSLLAVMNRQAWARDQRFQDLPSRLEHQDALDQLIQSTTRARDGYQLMDALQQAGVAAGVCQNAQDRYERDPQLKHLEWLVELPQTEIGSWPVKDFPVKMYGTPARAGGSIGRHGPNYGEDNEYVFGELLGLSAGEIKSLAEADVI
jgi:crotonobetainyl-CoA:carnitine CoA-transferase CaiB-like acyl-CoA transferase